MIMGALASIAVLVVAARAAVLDRAVPMIAPQPAGQGAGAAKKPAWKSRDEYDAFQAMANEKSPDKRVQLAEAFVQKYPSSDFKDQAYQVEMTTYQQKGDSKQAIEAAKKAVAANPDNITALSYLSFAFPFVFKPSDPDKDTQLTQADQWAKRGLEALQNLQKPANVTQQQYDQFVKQQRANFNSTLGFIAFQRKDYGAALTSLKAATEDNPSDSLAFSLMGQALLQQKPPDTNTAIWDLARSAALAKAANSPNAGPLQKYYEQVYVSQHGSDQGAQDIETQAASSAAPPAGFKVSPPEKHKPTGNQAVDAFYNIEDSLRVGGDQEKQYWQQVKGQPFQYGGAVASTEKGPDPETTIVKIAITDDSKAREGSFDIVLRTKQADAKYLKKGDLVRFQGTIAEYTQTPFALTLDGTINQEDLEAAKANKGKTARPTTRRRTTSR
jgi:tetratricopeptide (TPR) repeat protein